MITKNNLTHVLQTLSPEDINNAIEGPNDFIKLELHIFNAGGFGTIENVEYNEAEAEETQNNGNIYTDKDSFLQLLDETEALEY